MSHSNGRGAEEFEKFCATYTSLPGADIPSHYRLQVAATHFNAEFLKERLDAVERKDIPNNLIASCVEDSNMCEEAMLKNIQLLLEYGGDINAVRMPLMPMMTPLSWALERELHTIAGFLLDHPSIQVNSNYLGFIHKISIDNLRKLLVLLEKVGADMNIKNDWGETVYGSLCRGRMNDELLQKKKLLKEFGADISAPSASEVRHQRQVEKLITATRIKNLYAAKEILTESSDWLNPIKKYVPCAAEMIFYRHTMDDTAPACAFWIALENNWVQGVQLFAEAVSEADRERMLFQAIKALAVISIPGSAANTKVRGTHLPCIQALLDFPVNPNCKKRGITPLHALMLQDSYINDCLNALLKAGADPNATDDDGNTPIFYIPAVRSSLWKDVDLLKKYGANMNHRNKKGETILHATENTDVYDAAIYHGADPTIADNDGNLPMRPAKQCCIQ